jgi:hypothetical protein
MFLDKEVRGPIELTEDSGILPLGPTIADDVLPSQLVDATDNDLLLSASDKEESVAAASNGSHYSGPDLAGFESSSAASRLVQCSCLRFKLLVHFFCLLETRMCLTGNL